MAAGIDVGVHADRDPGARPAGGGNRVDALDLPLRLGVDAAEAELDGPGELGVGLTHPGEHDLLGSESGAQRYLDLPARIGIGCGTQGAQQPGDREGRVRLQRVVQGVRISAERLVDFAVAGRNHVGAVRVERGTEAGRQVGERHAAAVQRPLQPLE